MPIIDLFEAKSNILDSFEAAELTDFHSNFSKRAGVSIATTDIRFAWAMTMVYQSSNPVKAKQFAEFGYSHLEREDSFFGKSDFLRVLNGDDA